MLKHYLMFYENCEYHAIQHLTVVCKLQRNLACGKTYKMNRKQGIEEAMLIEILGPTPHKNRKNITKAEVYVILHAKVFFFGKSHVKVFTTYVCPNH